jgi:heme exporter protein D
VLGHLTLVWAAIGLTVAALLIAVVRSRYRARKDADLGAVSHQWLTEQRLGRPDSQR